MLYFRFLFSFSSETIIIMKYKYEMDVTNIINYLFLSTTFLFDQSFQF